MASIAETDADLVQASTLLEDAYDELESVRAQIEDAISKMRGVVGEAQEGTMVDALESTLRSLASVEDCRLHLMQANEKTKQFGSLLHS